MHYLDVEPDLKTPDYQWGKQAGRCFFGAAKYILVLWILFLVLTVLCNTQIGEQGLALIRKDYVLNYLYNKDVL